MMHRFMVGRAAGGLQKMIPPNLFNKLANVFAMGVSNYPYIDLRFSTLLNHFYSISLLFY